MSRPTTAREMLMAELLGDVTELLNRVETSAPAMDAAAEALDKAARDVVLAIESAHKQTPAFVRQAQVRAVEQVLSKAHDAVAVAMQQQSPALAQAARSVAVSEFGPVLRRLSVTLDQVLDRANRPWDEWLRYAATAAGSALLSAAIVAYLLRH